MKKILKGSQILSKLQGVYVVVEYRGYNIEYVVMQGTLKECFAWIREFAPVRASRWYSRSGRPTALEDSYINPYDEDMRNGDGRPFEYSIWPA